MYEDLNKKNRKMVILGAFLIFLAIVMLPIIFFNLFGFVDLISDKSFPPEKVRLYGGIFFALIFSSGLAGMRNAFKDTPMKSLEKYAHTTQNPAATLERLKETWKNGARPREWCRMDEAYLIAFINGAYGNIIPIKDAVWVYKSVTRLNFVVKTHVFLYVCYAGQKSEFIQLSETVIDFILQQIMEKHRDIAVGHNRDVEKLYREKDMAGLKEYAHQQRLGINLK